MKYLNTLFRYLAIAIVSVFMFLPLVLVSRLFKQTTPRNWFFIGKISLWVLGAKISINGQMPKDEESYVVIANHQSFIDIFIMAVCMKDLPTTVLVHKKLFKWPLLGMMLKNVGAIGISPENIKDGKISIDSFKKILRIESRNLIIFPEGKRTNSGQLLKFQRGAFVIAKKMERPIVPIIISGAYEFKPKGRIFIKTGEISVRFLDKIDTRAVNVDDLIEKSENLLRSCVP